MIIALIQMRYRLVWAAARGNRVRALLVAFSMMAAGYACVSSAAAGFGIAMAAFRIGHAAHYVAAVFNFLFLGSIGLSILLGNGLGVAFSDRELRRYPLTALGRAASRRAVALLSPMWLALQVLVLALSIGVCVLATQSPLRGVIGGLLFGFCCYLTASVILVFFERVVNMKAGPVILGVVMLAIMAVGLRTGSRATSIGDTWAALLPPSEATAVLLAPASRVFPALFTMAATVLILFFFLQWLEQKPLPHARSRKASKRSLVDAISDVFPGKWSPLIGKCLRYQLRCNRVRFSLAIVIPVLFAYTFWLTRKEGAVASQFGMLAMFFVVGMFATRVMLVNALGYDGPGIARYAIAGSSLVDTIRANSWVCLMLGTVMIVPSMAAFAAAGYLHPNMRSIMVLCCCGLAGNFIFNGLGLFTSVLAPRRASFAKLIGNDMSLAGNILVFGGFLAAFACALAASERYSFDAVVARWYLAPAIVVASGLFYTFCFVAIRPTVAPRTERLLRELGSAEMAA